MLINKSLRDNNLLQKIYKSANQYSEICNRDFLYLCFNKTDINKTEIYQARYEPKHFMHLCGINSQTLSPTDFYINSLNNNLTINDCTSAYNHSVSQISEKVSILYDLLNVKNMKMFKADSPNIQPPKAEFDVGIGNDVGFIGYRYDKYIKKFLPVTNMPQQLTKYCFDPQKISMVMSKEFDEKYFKKIEFEISKNLLEKIDTQYYYILSSFIDYSVLTEAFKDKLISKDKDVEFFEEFEIEK